MGTPDSKAKGQQWASSSILCPLLSRQGLSLNLEFMNVLRLVDGELQRFASLSLQLWLQPLFLITQLFYVGAGMLNLSLHAYATSTLQTEHLPSL